MTPVRILVTGDDDLLWAGVRIALQAMPHIEVVGDCSLQRAPQVARLCRPDIVLVGAPSDRTALFALLEQVHAEVATAAGIIFADRFEAGETGLLVDAGCVGALCWQEVDYEVLRRMIEAVRGGALVVLGRQAAAEILGAVRQERVAVSACDPLTERERAVLRGLAGGLTQKEIALLTNLSPRTVKRVVAALAQKLDAHSPFLLGLRACEAGLVL